MVVPPGIEPGSIRYERTALPLSYGTMVLPRRFERLSLHYQWSALPIELQEHGERRRIRTGYLPIKGRAHIHMLLGVQMVGPQGIEP